MVSKWITYIKVNKSSKERDAFIKFVRTLKHLGLIKGIIMSPMANWNGISFDVRVEILC